MMRESEITQVIEMRSRGETWGRIVKVMGYCESYMRDTCRAVGLSITKQVEHYPHPVTVRLSTEQRDMFIRLGGKDWLRSQLDQQIRQLS